MRATVETRPRSFAGGRRRPSLLALVLAMVVALMGSYLTAGLAHAATVYDIEGDWEVNTPGTVSRGDVVTGVWRINVNDDAPAPGNEPVENVKFTITLEHGLFKTVPDLCKTKGVDPESSLSADRRTLTCNLGPVKQGTAVVVQVPVVVDGKTGEQVTASGEIAGQTKELSPINIRNNFGMDMFWENSAGNVIAQGNGAFNFDFNWTLFLDEGSDKGPDAVSYNLTIGAEGKPVFLGKQSNAAPFNAPCTPNQNGRSAEGHPYSRAYPLDQRAPFVGKCELVKTGANTFRMTISGIDYSQVQVPTRDSAGDPLPAGKVAIASGSLWLQLRGLTAETGVVLNASAPLYTSESGQTDRDIASNNDETTTVTFPGDFSHAWLSRKSGRPWDNSYKVSPGSDVISGTHDAQDINRSLPNNTPLGVCTVLDPNFVNYNNKVELEVWKAGDPAVVDPAPPGRFQWYVGNDPTVMPGRAYNPDAFTGCGASAGWVNAQPANPAAVKAVRWTGNAGMFNGQHIRLRVHQRVQANAPIGQDVWTWGSTIRGGQWVNPGRGVWDSIVETPDDRYNGTNGARDILHVVYAEPVIKKAGDRSVVRPGEPAAFTLSYAANGTGVVPPTVDGYRIVDTLPVGMTYVPGSATPAPSITTNQGRQVLTWTLNKVPTNQWNTLTYQAVAGESVQPGQTLTNTATSSLRGQTSLPASAQVTTSSSGYTEIGKTADQWFINNPDGSGDGEGAWTVNLRSVDPLPQSFTDTIDILPYNGDGRGTKFAGSYDVASVTAVSGATVYYTTTDPEDLSDDPKVDSNGTPGSVADNTVGWTTTKPENPTAIRVIGPALAPGATQSFKINIVTDGADPGDTWVNRAQARAGHTQLVMRTSAPITMGTKYSASLKKYIQDAKGDWHDANDAADYPEFKFGAGLNYRIVVTNTGQGTLTDVEVKDDKNPELGNFHIDSLAPGKSETHEFTVKLTEDNQGVVNTACAAAAQPDDTEEAPDINCDPAGFTPINYDTVKSSDKDGSPVGPGEVINYTIKVTQEGEGPATGAIFSDDLADVLDDANYNNDAKASIGTVKYGEGVIGWTGDVGVGEVATITYSVTVKNAAELGDKATGEIYNPVTSPGCEVIDGQTPNCDTKSTTGWYTYSKVSDPKTGAPVSPGEKITYTLTVNHQGGAPVANAKIDDDLTDVIDDGTYNDDAKPSSGEVSYADGMLTWSGDLAVDQVVTIIYTVTVTDVGDDDLTNPVTTTDERGVCDKPVGCDVVHPKGRYLYSKVSDPESGATVEPGGVINYTITVTQQGQAAQPGATLTDDLAKVIDDVDYNGDVEASVGTATVKGGKLSWKGDLAVGAVETITYSVTVIDDGDSQLINGVTTDDPRGACDEPVGCQVEHHKASTPGGELPQTGGPALAGLAAGLGMLSLLTGGLVLAIRRRRLGGDRH